MSLNLRQTLRRWTTSTGIGGPIHRNTHNISQETLGGIKLPSSRLEGSVRNDTAFKLNSLEFEIVAFNDSGEDVRMCDQSNVGLRCSFHVFKPIASGETVRIDKLGGTFYPGRAIPKGQRIARVEYRVVNAPYFIKYNVQSDPITNEKFSISTAFDVRGIAVELRNTSPDVIEVVWDQSVYIDVDGTSSRLIRGNVRLMEKDRPQPNTVVPPGARVQETVFPVDHIKQGSGAGLNQEPLFPELVSPRSASDTKSRLSLLAGKDIRIFLRLLVNDQKQNVTIPLKVVGVEY